MTPKPRDIIGKLLRLSGLHPQVDILHYHAFLASRMHIFLSSIIPPVHSSVLVFDIGCSIGKWTRAFIAHGAHIIAVDPDERALEWVPRSEKVDIVHALCCSGTGKRYYCKSDSFSLGSMSIEWIAEAQKRFPLYSWNTPIPKPTITLDSLISRYGIPHYIKIDVEGGEYDVLQGLHQSVEWLSFEASYLFGKTLQCIERCVSLGMTRFNYMDSSWEFLSDSWLTATEIISVIRQLPFDKTIDIFVRPSQ